MGAWGYEPLETDGGNDWLSDELHQISKRVSKTIKSRRSGWAQRRAAAEFVRMMRDVYLIESGSAYIGLSKQCIEMLEDALDDESYMRSWSDPGKAEKSIKKQIAYFKRVLKDPKFK